MEVKVEMRTALLILMACFAVGCRASEPGPTLANEGRAEAAVSTALGEVRSPILPLRIRVLGARQVGTATLQVERELVRDDDGPSPADPQALASAAEALGGVSILTADGRRRLFPLQGEKPAPAPALPAPGASHRFRVLFASDPQVRGPLTVLVPGLDPIAGVPVS